MNITIFKPILHEHHQVIHEFVVHDNDQRLLFQTRQCGNPALFYHPNPLLAKTLNAR